MLFNPDPTKIATEVFFQNIYLSIYSSWYSSFLIFQQPANWTRQLKNIFFLNHYLHTHLHTLSTYNSTLLDIYRTSVGEKLKNIKRKENIIILRYTYKQYPYLLHIKTKKKVYSRLSSNLWGPLMNFMVHIKMLRFFLSSNLSRLYKIKSINLLSFSVEKELSTSFHSLGQTCLHYRNGNPENNVQWFPLQYYKDKEGLICL